MPDTPDPFEFSRRKFELIAEEVANSVSTFLQLYAEVDNLADKLPIIAMKMVAVFGDLGKQILALDILLRVATAADQVEISAVRAKIVDSLIQVSSASADLAPTLLEKVLEYSRIIGDGDGDGSGGGMSGEPNPP